MLAETDASGAATVTYEGFLAGADKVTASGTAGASLLVSNPAHVTWDVGKDVTYLDLSSSPSGGTVNQSVTLRASLSDVSLSPAATIAGAAIHFTLGASSCNGTTNAQGVASCSVTPPAAGQLVLSASYSGSTTYTSASASESFGVIAAAGSPPGPPTIDSVSAGEDGITVDFSPPANGGSSPITSYTVTCTSSDGGATGSKTGGKSPITVTGLTSGDTYTCVVDASNAAGPGTPSGASNAITLPAQAPTRAAQPIPALGRWTVLALALLVALIGFAALTRRRASHGTRR
jgi:hypothetical protein